MTQRCNTNYCPYWSNWTPWNSCSATCGTGHRVQKRYCSQPEKCIGDNEKVELCRGPECPYWSEWNSYSSCSVTCGGGQKQRSRVCSEYGQCGLGSSTERTACNTEECPYLTQWTSWSTCSATCGYGSQVKTRKCLSRAETVREPKCYSALSSTQKCFLASCPPKTTRPTFANFIKPTTKPRTTTRATTSEVSTTEDGSMKDFKDEIDKLMATGELDDEECVVLNVNGDCLDHHGFDKDDQIVDIGSCELPVFIMSADGLASGIAELVTDSKVRYKCMDSWRIRGNRNVECRCRGNRCRPRPRQVPRCISQTRGDE